jgi:acylphosphatase
MSPPDESDTAEIYVEGTRKMVEGFIRWCEKGNVGLSQMVGVEEVKEEEPTGLYDGFYVKTK